MKIKRGDIFTLIKSNVTEFDVIAGRQYIAVGSPPKKEESECITVLDDIGHPYPLYPKNEYKIIGIFRIKEVKYAQS